MYENDGLEIAAIIALTERGHIKHITRLDILAEVPREILPHPPTNRHLIGVH